MATPILALGFCLYLLTKFVDCSSWTVIAFKRIIVILEPLTNSYHIFVNKNKTKKKRKEKEISTIENVQWVFLLASRMIRVTHVGSRDTRVTCYQWNCLTSATYRWPNWRRPHHFTDFVSTAPVFDWFRLVNTMEVTNDNIPWTNTTDMSLLRATEVRHTTATLKTK